MLSRPVSEEAAHASVSLVAMVLLDGSCYQHHLVPHYLGWDNRQLSGW
jgi:hypothetical protein